MYPRERIIIDPEILCGKPVIKGTRIPVYIILNLLGAGKAVDDILTEYPALKKKDIYAALAYAGTVMEHEELHTLEQ